MLRLVLLVLFILDLFIDDFWKFILVFGDVLLFCNFCWLISKWSIVDILLLLFVVFFFVLEEVRDVYFGNNDNGLVLSWFVVIRRLYRISSLFVGFDGNSMDEGDEFMDFDVSDLEYRIVLFVFLVFRIIDSLSRMGKWGFEIFEFVFLFKVSSGYLLCLIDEFDGYGGYGLINIIF